MGGSVNTPMNMRNFINIVETARTLSMFEYSAGHCHVFAVAAQSLTNWPMAATLFAGRKRGEQSFMGGNDIVHVFLLDPSEHRFDSYGRGNEIDEYEHELEMSHGQKVKTIPVTEKHIAKMVQIGWLAPYTRDEVEAALPLARQTLWEEEYEGFDEK